MLSSRSVVIDPEIRIAIPDLLPKLDSGVKRKNWIAVLDESTVTMYYAYPKETWGLSYGEQGVPGTGEVSFGG